MWSLRLVRSVLVALAAAALLALPWTAPARDPLVAQVGPLEVGVRTGLVPALLLVLVTGIGAVVAVYAARNLAGQQRLARAAGLVALVVGALAVAVVAPTLPQLALGWTAAGLGIAGLVAHAGTPQARRAARLVAGRLLLGDLALWAAVAVVGLGLGTLELDRLGAAVATASPGVVLVAAVLVAVAGSVRSGLVPAHRWLPETAEGPSPVSALLHAGVVNGVGVLSLLLWPLVAASVPARALLLVVGATSVLLGTAQTRVRVDVKGRLAGSTSAQMGYLAVQVALGLPAAVLAHLVGHGLWKAALFLGAGGAVERARAAGSAPSRARRLLPAAVTAVVVVVAAAVVPGPWGAGLVTGPAALVPVLVAVAAVTVALRGRGARSGAGATAAVLVAAVVYVVGLRALTTAVEGEVPVATPSWGEAGWVAALALVALLVAVGVVAALLDARARAGRAPRLVALVAATSTPPVPWRDRLAGRRPVALPAAAAPTAEELRRTAALVDVASRVVAPLWPLESFVASSPLAALEHLDVADALRLASTAGGTPLGPSAVQLREAVASGRVASSALDTVLREHGLADGSDLHVDGRVVARADVARALLLHDDATTTAPGATRTPLDALASGPARSAAERATAYVDVLTARAYAGTAWPVPAPGVLGLLAADTRVDAVLGVRGASAVLAALPTRPVDALAVLLAEAGSTPAEAVALLSRLVLRSPGWAAHLAWRLEHDAALPWAEAADPVERRAAAYADLLAARLAVELLVARAWAPERSGTVERPRSVAEGAAGATARVHAALGLRAHGHDEVAALAALVHEVDAVGLPTLRLAAWESAYRAPLLAALGDRHAAAEPSAGPRGAQLVTCIDVRSERLRRRLEGLGRWETFGAAGFFGLPVSHVAPTGAVADLCPVLLRPVLTATERASAGGPTGGLADAAEASRAVERGPVVPVALAEAAGWVVGPWAVLRTLAPGLAGRVRDRLVARWGEAQHGRLDLPVGADGDADVAGLADLAEAFLRSTGLVDLAPVVVLCGHGASVSNNPHVAAYDCGACGGHSGSVSARLMARVLGDDRVRAVLAERGLAVPAGTRFLAGVHDTTHDSVVVVDPASGEPVAIDPAYADDLRAASEAVRLERLASLPQATRSRGTAAVRRHLARRAADWAQVRPEWGLAGNAALVIGPRDLTAGLDLDGRAFLQSYRHDLDPDGRLLESLMAGPFVVAQWINLQYWSSTVDPRRWGAGDKTTHNVVAAGGGHHPLSGVLTGARGDLRIGLPWQAVSAHAPEGSAWTGPTTHEPVRLLAVVAAPAAVVDAVLARRPEVARLVLGGWVSLVVADPSTSQLLRLDPARGWVPAGTADSSDDVEAGAAA